MLRKLEEDLEERRTKLDAEELTVRDASVKAETIVRLNVGGTIFDTSQATLLQSPHDQDSVFHKLLSGRFTAPRDAEGRIFIDRDAAHFRIILNWLRSGHVPPRLDNVDELMVEADFYQLVNLMAALSPGGSRIVFRKRLSAQDLL